MGSRSPNQRSSRPPPAPAHPARTAAVLLLLVLFPVLLAAQQSRIEGRVLEDETGEPLDGTTVELLSNRGDPLDREVTDERGRFRFEVEDREGIRLRAARLGYEDNVTPLLHLENRRYFEVEVRLSTDAILLAPLEVVARSESRTPYVADFEHRRRRGMGRYITRETIEERDPSRVTDLLAEMPGVRLLGQGRGSRRTVVMGRGTGSCPASIWVDGLQVNRGPAGSDLALDDVVSPESVYGIEVYRGSSTVPPDFVHDGACGVIVVWTRRGDSGG